MTARRWGLWIAVGVIIVLGTLVQSIVLGATNPAYGIPNLVRLFTVVVSSALIFVALVLLLVQLRERSELRAFVRRDPASVVVATIGSHTLAEQFAQPGAAWWSLALVADPRGLAVRRRGGSVARIAWFDAADVSTVGAGIVPGRLRDHPAIIVTTGPLALAFAVYRPEAPFRRASPEEAAELAERIRTVLAVR